MPDPLDPVEALRQIAASPEGRQERGATDRQKAWRDRPFAGGLPVDPEEG